MLGLLAFIASCIHDQLIACGTELCPANGICLAANRCVTQTQLDACSTLEDGADCEYDALMGTCQGGACEPAFCGNGVQEGAEACDDGNEIGGDGCGARCDSAEQCGNGVIDYLVGEQCDQLGLGAGFTGDGCSSGCELEYDLWREVTPRGITARGGYAMTFDQNRGEVVIFGGGTAQNSSNIVSQLRGETWVYDTLTWARREPAFSPSARYGAAMVHMTPSKQSVMFGGFDANGTALAETWAWNGVTWRNLSPAMSPPARGDHAMAYDSFRNRIVLYGGVANGTPLGDTWEFDGTTWTQVPGVGPPARSRHVLVYDPARFRTVMWGGMNATVALSETWELGNGQWTRALPPASPNGVVGAAGTFDPRINAIVVVGGKSSPSTTPGGDHFSYNGLTWTNIATPAARTRHGLAFTGDRLVYFGGFQISAVYATTYEHTTSWSIKNVEFDPGPHRETPVAFDVWRHRLVVFGGTLSTAARSDTWEWDGVAWRERIPLNPPTARFAHSSAYDEKRRVTVIFGGTASSVRGDTWTWDGTDWLNPATTGPSPRFHAAMAYDAARERVVLFGGEDNTSLYGDTWTWDGASWMLMAPATSPSPRANAALAYDRLRGTVLLYGGDNAPGELWEWDGATWTQLPMTAGAPTVIRASLAYDPVRAMVLLFGGTDLTTGLPSNAVWEWNRVIWRLRAPPIAPPPRFGAAVSYDPVLHRIFMFGGEDEVGALGDTWSYGFQAATPADACIDTDTDGDGLAGCGDPDCWARCTPYCPPAATCASPPLCGDGVCQPLEDDLLCDADC